MRLKLFFLFLLMPVVAFSETFPHAKDIPYEPFDVQEFFVKHNCFLANILIDGLRPSEIIRRCCYENDVNPKWILTRMQVERCLISGKREGNYFIIPGHRKRIKIVLRECCGFGLSWHYHGHKLNGYKYIGFVNQVSHCASFMARNLRQEGITRTLYEYDPTTSPYDGVMLFKWTWSSLFGKDK